LAEPVTAVAVLTEETFDAAIAGGTVLVDFWAAWCGPCHALTPVLSELAGEVADARIAKVDVADFPKIGERFGVTSLPTLIVFRDGKPAKKMFGAKNKRQLTRALDEVLSAPPEGGTAAP
jgi:thioredoxin 1